ACRGRARPVQGLWGPPGRERRLLGARARRVPGPPRPERGRQDDHDPDGHLLHRAERRRPSRPRAARLAGQPRGHQGRARHRTAGRLSRSRPECRAEPDRLCELLRHRAARGRHARHRAHALRRAGRAPWRAHPHALGGHEAPPHAGAGAAQRPAPPRPRRADHRPRSAGATDGLGAHPHAQAPGHDHPPHHALHGGGGSVPTLRALRVWRRNLESWKRYAPSFFVAALGEPIFYLLAIGYGLGRYVARIDGLPYAAFLAPGMVAFTAMNSATFETTFGSFTRMTEQNTYAAILATPCSVADIVAGDILWAASKRALSVFFVLLLTALCGLVASPVA